MILRINHVAPNRTRTKQNRHVFTLLFTIHLLLFTIHLQQAASDCVRLDHVKIKPILAYETFQEEENKNSATTSSVSLEHGASEKYIIDTNESVLTWEGSVVFGFEEEHIGYVYISKGELMIENGQLTGGAAEIDMNTIEYGDKENKNSPIKHLKSSDYFDVEKFPISTFSITKVAYAVRGNIKVTGDLTIKGITNPVTFPAKIEVKDGIIKANGKMVLDRTQWGIRYRSGKFYDKFSGSSCFG